MLRPFRIQQCPHGPDFVLPRDISRGPVGRYSTLISAILLDNGVTDSPVCGGGYAPARNLRGRSGQPEVIGSRGGARGVQFPGRRVINKAVGETAAAPGHFREWYVNVQISILQRNQVKIAPVEAAEGRKPRRVAVIDGLGVEWRARQQEQRKRGNRASTKQELSSAHETSHKDKL